MQVGGLRTKDEKNKNIKIQNTNNKKSKTILKKTHLNPRRFWSTFSWQGADVADLLGLETVCLQIGLELRGLGLGV